MAKRDAPPKSQLDSQPLWSTAVDAQLRVDPELEIADRGDQSAREVAAASPEWLTEVLSEYGAMPPVDLVAEHYTTLGEMEQSSLFGELNVACGYDYAIEVVQLAKKKSGETTQTGGGKATGGESGS